MLIGTMLVRNEAGRWLETVLKQMKSVCDKIIILDDGSTDDTPEICQKYGEVFYSDRSYWGTNELKQRKFLWELATHEAKTGDWILCLDADELLCGIGYLLQIIGWAESIENCNGVSFPLFDMWDETHYRHDDLWNAHTRPWIMCVRYDEKKEYSWRKSTLHCGRFPENACTKTSFTESVRIQHWGWSRLDDRQTKYDRYMQADLNGKNGNLAQYQSILDENPNLRRFEL